MFDDNTMFDIQCLYSITNIVTYYYYIKFINYNDTGVFFVCLTFIWSYFYSHLMRIYTWQITKFNVPMAVNKVIYVDRFPVKVNVKRLGFMLCIQYMYIHKLEYHQSYILNWKTYKCINTKNKKYQVYYLNWTINIQSDFLLSSARL